MYALRVSHHCAVTGCLRVGLKHLDALCRDAFGADRGRVVLDLGSRAVAQDPLMNEREMTDVKEVLHYARPACPHAIWPRDQHPIRRIVQQLEPWDPWSAAAEIHPYDAACLRRMTGSDLRLCRRSPLGVGWPQHSPPLHSICTTLLTDIRTCAVAPRGPRQSAASRNLR